MAEGRGLSWQHCFSAAEECSFDRRPRQYLLLHLFWLRCDLTVHHEEVEPSSPPSASRVRGSGAMDFRGWVTEVDEARF